MECRDRINIVNFIRGLEPRLEMDLFRPVREQMRLARTYGLPTTWLLQYDALTSGPYVEFLKREMPENHEVGIWFECVQPNVEAAGIAWRGRWAWDWHSDVGFSVGYTPEERERIADCFLTAFHREFGRYPASVGSWLFDAHLLGYLHDKYGIVAACNCKDQFGTDGYTLWGGYWANGYYPSRANSFMPAQHPARQIPVPVFRMLGSDPLYQYDAQCSPNGQLVVTLEPVYPAGGGDPAWVDWFFDENRRGPCLAMSYAQVGQENSFGWDAMAKGLEYQYRRVAELRDAGAVQVETLGDTGRWFRARFPMTPESAVVTLSDWKNENHAGVWYLSAYGRLNLFATAERELRLRDWQLFDEDYTERYLVDICTTPASCYDALPVIDSMVRGSLGRFSEAGEIGAVTRVGEHDLAIDWRADSGNHVRIDLAPETLTLTFFLTDGELVWSMDSAAAREPMAMPTVAGDRLRFHHRGRGYELIAEAGRIVATEHGFAFRSVGRVLRLRSVLIGAVEV